MLWLLNTPALVGSDVGKLCSEEFKTLFYPVSWVENYYS
jgi:hypothetical protein